MSAVAALPYLDLALGEDLLRLHVVQERTVSLLVMLLDGCYPAELLCQLVEAFLLCGLRKSGIHIGPLVVLAVCRCGEVLSRCAYALQLLEPHLGMFLLVVCRLLKERGYLLEAVLLRP